MKFSPIHQLFASLFILICSLPKNQAQNAQIWELATAKESFSESYRLPLRLEPGPLQLDATIRLDRLDGTAASVWIGEFLNLGFDSRSGSLFAEGKAIGKTKMLRETKGLIEAGKPFELSISIDANQIVTAKINRETVLSQSLKQPVTEIRFRPHRNRMSLERVRLEGTALAPNTLRVRAKQVPLLTLGPGHRGRTVLELAFNPVEAVTIETMTLDFSGTTDLADIDKLTVLEAGQQVLYHGPPKKQLPIHTDLLAGSIELEIRVEMQATAPLTHQVGLRVNQMDCWFKASLTNRTITPEARSEHQPFRLARSIHQQGEFDCHTFWIPGIARAKDGSLLAVYDIRYNSRRDLQEHMDIGLSRSTDGGETWSLPRPIMDMGEHGGKPEKENGCSDPNILVDEQTGEIFVAAVWTWGKPGTHQWRGKGSEPGLTKEKTAQFMVVRSQDHGVTWSAPENWTKRLKKASWHLFAPAPGNGITLRNGTLVMPTQGRDDRGTPFSNISWSQDHGKTWTVSNPARGNTTECAVVELADGSLMLNMRDNRNRSDRSDTNGRAVGTTADLGQNWTTHASDHGALPEPVCMASLISIQHDGQPLLIFSNPNSKSGRQRMMIQSSLDQGKTWIKGPLLDAEGGAYSSLVQVDDKTIGILYESSQADFVFQKIAISELLPE